MWLGNAVTESDRTIGKIILVVNIVFWKLFAIVPWYFFNKGSVYWPNLVLQYFIDGFLQIFVFYRNNFGHEFHTVKDRSVNCRIFHARIYLETICCKYYFICRCYAVKLCAMGNIFGRIGINFNLKVLRYTFWRWFDLMQI